MQAPEFDLAKLLHPIELGAFFHDWWEKQPLHVPRASAEHYRGLYSLADVDRVIALTRPKFTLADQFEAAPPVAHNFIQGNLADDDPVPLERYPGISDIHQAFACGKTVIINSIHHRWEPVARMCRNLEGVFNCPVHANMYLTPKGAQGFNPHYDGHDVFVLQIEGSKHWKFYGSGPTLPMADYDVPVARKELGAPTLEAVVQPGDLLYMPRGHIHEAFTSAGLSMHLTVGVRVFRWANLLEQALQNMIAEDVRLRESLPPGGLTKEEVRWTLKARFFELLRGFAESARAEDAIAGLASRFISKLAMLPNEAFIRSQDAETITLDTELSMTAGIVWQIVQGEYGVSLEFPGGRLDGPPKIASALRFIARTPRFAVRDLPEDLTADAKLVLARRLVRERFLTVAGA